MYVAQKLLLIKNHYMSTEDAKEVFKYLSNQIPDSKFGISCLHSPDIGA